MSKIFYDHLVIMEEVEIEMDKLGLEHEEKQEMIGLIDGIIHHRILDRVLTHLPKAHHKEFLQRFHSAPYDHFLLDYINARIDEKIEEHIKDEAGKIKKEVLKDLKHHKKLVVRAS